MRGTPFYRLHNLAVFLALAILGMLAWQTHQTQEEVLEANASVTQRLQRITAVQELHASLRDIETGERGFVISGNDLYLAPYTAALARLPAERARLDRLAQVAPSPQQADWFAELDAAIADKLRISADNIATRRELGAQAALERLPQAGGREAMDRLREHLDADEQFHRQQLVTENREVEISIGRSRSQALFGGLAVAILFLSSFWFLDRNLRARRALTHEAQNSTRKMEALLSAIPDMLLEIDASGPRRLGLHGNEPVPGGLAGALQQRLSGNEASGLLHGFNWRDDNGRECEVRIVPAGDATHLAIVRDITDTQRTRRRLHDQQLFLRSVVDADANPIFVRDESGRFVLCNTAFATLLGRRPAELEGRSSDDIQNIEAVAPLLAGDAELLAGNAELRIPAITLVDAAGTQHWMQLLKRPLTLANGHRSAMTVAVDITERLRVERMKSEFVSTISHELRTPLTAIRGSLSMIRSGMAGPVEGSMAQMIDIADKNSERLVRLINDVLDIEKLEAGRLPITPETLGLRALLEHAVADNEPYAAGYGVRLELDFQADALQLQVDPDRFAQIMANLLSNAIKHSPEGGLVTVGARRLGGVAEISVTDRGNGIPEAFQPQVFDRFAQADGSDVRQRGGTGLGLAITRSLVQHMDGDIGFESRSGEGTRFFVRFPLVSDEAASTREADGPERPRILMVESDHDVAAPLVRLLEEAGYSVALADAIAQARLLLADTQFHALTLDPAMPDEDSLTFLRELRTSPAFRHLPVIMLGIDTARQGASNDDTAGGALGVVDWLSAPHDASRLLTAVQTSLRKHACADVLHIEDDDDVRALIARLVPHERIRLHAAATLAEAREALSRRHFDLLILDLLLPDGDGSELLPELARSSPPTPVVVFSAVDATTRAANGAMHRLLKSRCDPHELVAIIDTYLRTDPPSAPNPEDTH